MEKSKLISTVIARLKIAYPYYFRELSKEDLVGLVDIYQEELSVYNELTLKSAVMSIIRKNKFMPTLKEILDECENSIIYQKSEILEKMKSAGYFKSSREVDKAYHFLNEGIIPRWLLEDMKKYGYKADNDALTSESGSSTKRIGGNM